MSRVRAGKLIFRDPVLDAVDKDVPQLVQNSRQQPQPQKAAEKSLKIIFRIFQKQFRFTPCFSPISERTPRTAERRFYHAKTI